METIAEAEADGVTVADARSLLDSQKSDMRQLQGLVSTLLALVNDFLFFSKLRQGPGNSPVEELVEFKPCVLLEEVGFVGAPVAKTKELKFTSECNVPNDMFLVGPMKDLKRILGNLVRTRACMQERNHNF
jgi:signal transduction histidine kinase